MQIFLTTTSGEAKIAARAQIGAVALTLAGAVAMLAGCASPGRPLPPTLNLPLPAAASSLSAERVGATVIVRWTTPERTTDKLLIRGTVEAEICRELVGGTAAAGRAGVNRAAPQNGTAPAGPRPCSSVAVRSSATPGHADEAVDTLPAELAGGAARLMVYRVQLKNAAGRTAGASSEVFAAAGDAPEPVANFRARPAKGGIVLEWTPDMGSKGDRVELLRKADQPPTQQDVAAQKKTRNPLSALSAPKEPVEVRLRAAGDGAAGPSQRDAGGMIDRTAEMGQRYTYVAWRVRTVELGGRPLEIRSAVSPAVTVKLEDIFAPDAPQGLVAVPAFAGEGNAVRPASDLSWEPNEEPRVAGYRVYRQERGDAGSSGWQMISGPQPLTVAAYRDADVSAGHSYAYRTTAMGVNRMESGPSNEAEETTATQ